MNTAWYTCNLGDAMLAGESLDKIRASFPAHGDRTFEGGDMAVFVRHESEGRLHCEVQVYFSPAAAGLARTFGAIACTRPSPLDLGLLAGPESAWESLFLG
jgi:hypothetical protein